MATLGGRGGTQDSGLHFLEEPDIVKEMGAPYQEHMNRVPAYRPFAPVLCGDAQYVRMATLQD